MGAGEMDGKIISEPSVKVPHNTCMTCHENPVHEENTSTIYSVLEKCGKAFPSHNDVLKGIVSFLTVGSAVSPRTQLRKIPQEYQEGNTKQEYPRGD